MSKILILSNNFRGLNSFRKEVLQAIINAGYEVIVSAPTDDKTSLIQSMGCTVIPTQFNRKGMNPFKDIALMFRYIRLIHSICPTLVLSYTIKPNIYGGMACALSNVPQIANITGLGSVFEHPGLLRKVAIVLYKIGMRSTEVTFFQNQANLDYSQEHCLVKGITRLIPGSGVNLQWHAFKPYPSGEVIRFVYVGRVLREKGFEQLAEAAKYIRDKYPNTEFHVVGDIEDSYQTLMQRLTADGTIIYHGRQSDVRPFLEQSHCMVHPSFYSEGMSNVLLEACAAGRPVITTDRPGCADIVDDGVNGFIVRQRDSRDLISKVEQFIALSFEEKQSMGLAARAKVERQFDRQIVIDAYLEEIDKIVNKPI